MKILIREFFDKIRLIGGLAAFACAGVLAVAGGNADQLGWAFIYVSVASGLAITSVLLLSQSRCSKQINLRISSTYQELIEAAGVTDEMFNRFYRPVVEHLETPNLELPVKALKRRRGTYLGSQNDHENVRRNRDRWTYAVFLAAIGKTHERGMELVVFATPQDARDWLSHEKLVVSTLIDALSASPDRHNAITRLLTNTIEETTDSARKRPENLDQTEQQVVVSDTTSATGQSMTKRQSQPTTMNSLTNESYETANVKTTPFEN